MYKFQIRRRKEFNEENEKIRGFNNVCTGDAALNFISSYCELYKYFFRSVWNAHIYDTTEKCVCTDETLKTIVSVIAEDIEKNKLQVYNEKGKNRYFTEGSVVKAWYFLYSASAAVMTKKAVSYIKQHKEDIVNQFDIPTESSESILSAFISHPALNLKYHTLAIHDGGNSRIVTYTEADTSKKSKKKYNISAGVVSVYLETPQMFYKCGLTDKEIKDNVEAIFHSATAVPCKIRVYGRPDSFPRILSNIKSIKNKCAKTESSCFLWFNKTDGILGDALYAYIGSVDDYVKFILSTICVSKQPDLVRTEDEGRCPPYLSNPNYFDEALPKVKVNMAGIDIGFHTMYTVAAYRLDKNSGQIEDVHIGEGMFRNDKDGFKSSSIEEEVDKASTKLVDYLKSNYINSVAIENQMFAKLQKVNSIKVPRFLTGRPLGTFHRLSASDEEAYYIALTAAMVTKMHKAGIKIYAVETFNSSKVCSNCGELTRYKYTPGRVFECPYCGSVKDRDENAARNLLNKLYAADLRHKTIRTVKLNKKFEEAVVRCVGDCYEMELIEKAAV